MFITFEGPDGSGKSTQIRLLADQLRQAGRAVLLTREIGGTPLGEQIRTLVQHQDQVAIDPLAEMLLIAAARAQHVEQVIRPHLRQSTLVLSDRYVDSSLVYQGYALGIGWEKVCQVNEAAISGLWPDLTILLMLEPEEAYRRSTVGQQADRIERRGLEYYRQVCAGYAHLVECFPGRVRPIDASRSVAEIQHEISAIVAAHLEPSSTEYCCTKGRLG